MNAQIESITRQLEKYRANVNTPNQEDQEKIFKLELMLEYFMSLVK
jgi:hypothetical protein